MEGLAAGCPGNLRAREAARWREVGAGLLDLAKRGAARGFLFLDANAGNFVRLDGSWSYIDLDAVAAAQAGDSDG